MVPKALSEIIPKKWASNKFSEPPSVTQKTKEKENSYMYTTRWPFLTTTLSLIIEHNFYTLSTLSQ